MMRNLGGAIGIAVCATILNDRTNLHFLRLAETSEFHERRDAGNVGQGRREIRGGQCGDVLHGHAAALKQLWSLT